MKKAFLFTLVLLMVSGIVYAQDEYIKIMDFEEQTPPSISASWDYETGFSFAEEPHHGGDFSLIMIIYGGTGDWNFSQWSFPSEVGTNGTVDLSGTDEMSLWVYSESIFQMNFEFGGANLGYRGYGQEDLGTWKQLAWWYPEETAANFTAVNGWGSFLNPAAMSGFPNGFEGTIYIDDINARIRKETPEREYFLLNGFNSEADMANVEILNDLEGGIKTDGVEPAEGDGYLYFVLTSDYDRFSIDISDIPEFEQYERLHFDIYFDGSGSWGNFGYYIDTTPIDANGKAIVEYDADGNLQTDGMTLVNGSYAATATKKWHTYVQQYGPVEGTNGFAFQSLKDDLITPVYNAAEGKIFLRFGSNGDAAVEGSPIYMDNIRLSRPVGTPVTRWELY